MEDSPDLLLKGWTVETRPKKKGSAYKCYVAPLTGRKFYSKKKVFEFLNSENLSKKSRSKKSRSSRRGADKPSTSQVMVPGKDTEEALPPGWIKTIKVRKSDQTKKDPYYTDPATGYVFRSRKDVFRYLDTGEIGKHAFKPKSGDFNNLELADRPTSPPNAAKQQRVEGSTTKRCLFEGQSSNVDEKTVKNEQRPEPSETKGIIPISNHTSVQGGKNANLSNLASLESDVSKKGRVLRSATALVTALPSALTSSEKQLHQIEDGVEKSENKKTQLKSSKNKDKKELSFPRRASKRLAGVKADPVPDLESGRRKSQVGTVHVANPVIGEKTTNSSHQVVGEHGSASEPKSETTPNESGKVQSESENLTPKDGDTLVIDEGNLSLKKCENPVGEKSTFGELGNADENPECSITLPFGDSWPDPCLEFAFKTLTGAIPVEDDLMIQDYFQSVQTQNTSDNGVDEYNQTSDLFRFDPLEKPSSPPQKQKNPVLPAQDTANMINFGTNNGLQQQQQQQHQQPIPGRGRKSRDR